MKCLAVNTATATLSIAILDDDKTLFHFATAETRDQGNVLLTHIRRGLAECGLTFSDLDLLAVVTGPGSFTGIRVGLSAMRALALAAGKPIVGITSFEMFAQPEPGVLNAIAVESWREELYLTAVDDTGRMAVAPTNTAPEVFAAQLPKALPVVISGDAKRALAAHLPEARLAAEEGDARTVGRIALQKFNAMGADGKPLPYYMRNADVTISSKPVKKLKD